jgi:hypothetical protein
MGHKRTMIQWMRRAFRLGLWPAIVLAPIVALAVISADVKATVRAASGVVCTDGPDVRQLSYIVNSRDRAVQCFGIVLANDTITAIRIENHLSAERILVTDFPVARIESERGAVLDGRPGHDAIILKGRFGPGSAGAALVIRYLHNGVTNEYRQCAVSIEQGPQGGWRLLNARHENVSSIAVETWALPLIGVVGIATLDGACTDAEPSQR